MNRVLFGFGLSVVSIALAGVVQEGAIAGNYFPKEIAKRIAKSTSASVLLPSEDSFKKTFFSDDRNIFATTNTADQYKEYSLNFSPIPDCNANVCMRFSVSAKRGKEINTQIAQGRNASSEYIELVDGSKALASTHCGASCWGVVQWKYQNILYEVWTKARGAEGAISIANSMVKVGDRSKSSSIATDNRSTQSIANLPDGSYFYGETQNPRQMASQFVIFRKKGDVVFGQEYFTNTGSNSCFVGQIKSGNTLSRVTQAILGEPIRRGEANWEFPEKSSLDLGSLNNRESLKYNLGLNQAPDNFKGEPENCARLLSKQIVSISSFQNTGNQSNNSEPLIQGLVRQLRKRAKDFESSTTGAKAGYIKDRRSLETKQTLNSFVTAWKKVDINSAPFFGSWSDYDGRITIYPSTQKGRVCVLQTGEGYGNLELGTSSTNVIKTDSGRMFFIDGRYLGFANAGSQKLAGDIPSNSPLPLSSVESWVNQSMTDSTQRTKVVQQAEAGNCTASLPEESSTDQPIAQPIKPITPIARASTYAYPNPEEFAQLRQTLKTQPSQKLSAADNQSRQTFLKKWQTDNPPIAPFIGAWTTREGRSIYVYPSTQRLRACVVTVKDGNPSFTMALAQGPELRYGNSGLFKTEQGDLLASRQEGEKNLVPVFAAVGVPVLSEDVQQELAQAKCGGLAIQSATKL